MTAQNLLKDASKLKLLAQHLATCPEVTKFDEADEREAWTLAHTFSDLEHSFRTFLDDELPRLTNNELSPSAIYDLLLEIGEELRHILYHTRDPKFYRYLHDGDDRA